MEVFAYGFMQNAFLAGTVVAVMAGVIGYFVVLRRLAFATEALSHGGFAGATGAVLIGQDVFVGMLTFTTLAGILMGVLGDRLRGRDVAIGATLAFSLALGSLFLTMSTRLAGEAVNILFGNILAISPADVRLVTLFACLSLAVMGVIYRPLLFASLDPEIAEARGLPVRGLSVGFMVLLGCAVATAVQIVGVLLIFALLILPAATAQQLTARPPHAIMLSVAIGVACVWLGLIIGFYVPYPPSFFITTLSFVGYLAVSRRSFAFAPAAN
ncbi:MAG: metal ABC transporter permease [Chloroflexi bacterium]|nr:metal ABC transporter permease [Chloroflexota bacterium]MBV9600918.1 metal ABC transporter permease [Chloroflexota bacterium]